MRQEHDHDADSASANEPTSHDVHAGARPSPAGQRDAPPPSVAVSWYADVALERFAYVGPMAVRLLGVPAAAWKEDGFWASHLPADERERVQAQRQRHVAAGRDFELDYHMVSADGSLVRIRELTTVTRVADGSLALRGLFLRNDITPFAGTVTPAAASYASWLSHELSQPLGAVLANADAMRHMLRASPPRVEEALEALADIANSARDAASFLAAVRRSIRSMESTSDPAPAD